MFRVELVEKNLVYNGEFIGDIERVSLVCKNEKDIEINVSKLLKDFKEEIEKEKYYIKITFIKIDKEV